MPAHTIDEVIVQLDEIIARSRSEKSRLGFFATLYRNVTLKVREGIQQGLFQDGPRMERLDVTFANRYIDALEKFTSGEEASRCWLVSFHAAEGWRPIILQHLLLGMNAHINLDLGIAAAEVCPGDKLPSLKHDFDAINGLLAGMLDKVQEDIEELSPWIKFLDRISDDKVEDAIINFSMSRARDCAWSVAVRLASASPEQAKQEIAQLDAGVTRLGNIVWRPRELFVKLGLLVIRLRESNDIPRVIDVLSET